MSTTAPQPATSFWTLANVFTFARFALAPVCAIFFMQGTYWGVWVAGWAAGLAMFTDVCDGYFARRQKTVSDLGKIFDPLADAVFFIIVWSALAVMGAFPVWFVLPFMLREVVQHLYIRPVAMQRGVALGANIWGKLKTLAQTLVLITICWFEFFIHYWPDIASWVRPANMAMIGATGLISLLSIAPYFRALRNAGGRVN
jgi:CDP-diacylglycerol--glycerol-3-phosphate 3-phosphatidyltransferase